MIPQEKRSNRCENYRVNRLLRRTERYWDDNTAVTRRFWRVEVDALVKIHRGKGKVRVSTNKVGSECIREFEIDDDMTEDEISMIAEDTKNEMVEWGWERI